MKRSDELKRQQADLLDEAEKIANRAAAENRELRPSEDGRYRAIMDSPGGLLAFLKDEIERAEADEKMKYITRANGTSVDMPTPEFDRTGGGPYRGGQPRVLTPRLKMFAGNGDRTQACRDARDSALWLRVALLRDGAARQQLESRRGAEWVASANESNPVDGGYLCPAPLADAIIFSREQVGAARKLGRVFEMSSDTLQIPKQSGSASVYYPSESSAITDSDLDFARVGLTARKRAVLVFASNELVSDAALSVVDFIAADCGHRLALREDQEAFQGTGTSDYGAVEGLRQKLAAATASLATASSGHDTWAELDLADLASLMALVPDQYRVLSELKWCCSSAFKLGVFDRLALGAGGALARDFADGMPRNFFAGHEIVLSDRMPVSTAADSLACAFGNFPQALAIGERSKIAVALSEHLRFDRDELAIRVVTRYDLNWHGLGNTSNAGAVCGLMTAAS